MNIKFIPRTVSIDKHYQKRPLLYRTNLTTELGKNARTFQWSFDKFQLWVYENSRIWHVFNFRKWVKIITYNYSFYPRGQKTCSECEYSKIEKRVFNGCCCVLCINHESSTMCQYLKYQQIWIILSLLIRTFLFKICSVNGREQFMYDLGTTLH